jgi:hypothetical protein
MTTILLHTIYTAVRNQFRRHPCFVGCSRRPRTCWAFAPHRKSWSRGCNAPVRYPLQLQRHRTHLKSFFNEIKHFGPILHPVRRPHRTQAVGPLKIQLAFSLASACCQETMPYRGAFPSRRDSTERFAVSQGVWSRGSKTKLRTPNSAFDEASAALDCELSLFLHHPSSPLPGPKGPRSIRGSVSSCRAVRLASIALVALRIGATANVPGPQS